jgi:hypothetical protein
MHSRAALCAFALLCLLPSRGVAQAKKGPASPPSYTPLATVNDEGNQVVAPPIQVAPIPESLRDEYKIHPFYKKHVVIRGIPVIGAEEVTDYAFLECAWTLDHMLHERDMALKALVAAKVRVGIIGVKQYTMDIPENQRPRMMASSLPAFYKTF